MCLRSASGRTRSTQTSIICFTEMASCFSSICPAERRSTLRKISTMRARRLDSELISRAICLRFSSVSGKREINSLEPCMADSGVRIS